MRRGFILFLTVLVAFFCRAQDAEPVSSGASLEGAVYFVETDVGTGLAFLVEGSDGGTWMVSCNSVFQGAKRYKIVNAFGHEVSFSEQVMVARNCDLILFKTERHAGLRRAEFCGMEQDLYAFRKFGDGSGDQIIIRLKEEREELKAKLDRMRQEKKKWEGYATRELDEHFEEVKAQVVGIDRKVEEYNQDLNKQKSAGRSLGKGFLLMGKAVALGPDRVEISALISRNDIGGPVVNRDNEVIGVSSHLMIGAGLPDWVVEGTRFDEPRRFALKIDGVQWMPMARKEYERQGAFVQENFDTLDIYVEIIELLDDSYFRTISILADNKYVQKWIDAHNKAVEDYHEARAEVYYSQSELDKAIRGIERKMEKDDEAFLVMLKKLEKDSGRIGRVTVPYYQEQLSDLEDLYCAIRKRMEQVLENR